MIKKTAKNLLVGYTILGIIFGCVFPIIAISIELYYNKLDVSYINIKSLHQNNILLYMIDTAPVFLGLFSFAAGVIRSRLELKNIELNKMVNYDDLTGLYNRRFGNDRIKELILKHMKTGEFFVVAFLDLDKFKYINDTSGHIFGDEVLKVVARRLVMTVENIKNVIRLGGDEFMIMIEGDLDLLDQKLNHIADCIAMPIKIREKSFLVEASIGVVYYPEHGQNLTDLLKKADIAMYHCKNVNSRRYCIFSSDMSKEMEAKVDMSNALESVLEKDELYLLYQPIIDAQTERLIAAEALIRWKSENFNRIVSPMEFIPLAEQNGKIIEIGYWIIETACKLVKKYEHEPKFPIISINISAVQIKEWDFIDNVASIIKKYKVNTNSLKFEITESNSMEEIENSKLILKKLKDMGIKISMDDFGTGHSSLAELKKMMIDYIKIDKSFIDDLHVDASNELIVDAMISMAKSLKIQIIAEGVETKEQFEYLKANGCDYIQGYLFSKPIGEKELVEKFVKGIKM